MCKAMEELREQSIQRGIDQSRIESIKNIMEGLKYTAQQAMDLLKIPVSCFRSAQIFIKTLNL